MKLYRVDVYGSLYVLAQSPDEAQSVAIHCKIGEVDSSRGDQVSALERVPTDWRDALPFAQDNTSDITIRQLFDRGEIET